MDDLVDYLDMVLNSEKYKILRTYQQKNIWKNIGQKVSDDSTSKSHMGMRDESSISDNSKSDIHNYMFRGKKISRMDLKLL
jgi:hypothetical protein